MEIPDVIVINKAEHPLTDTMLREIRGVLSLANLERSEEEMRGRWQVPILKTEAANGAGVSELIAKLDEHRAHILAHGQLAERRRRNLRNEVLAIATARMRRRLEDELREDPGFKHPARGGRRAPARSRERRRRAARTRRGVRERRARPTRHTLDLCGARAL